MLQSVCSCVVQDLRKNYLCFHCILSISMHQTLANITTGNFWKQLQYHKQRGIALARKHARSRERQRRVQPPTKTWMSSVQWGYTFPSLFNSRTSGQYLVRPSLLEIILSRGMKSHCCIQRLWKQVWALGTGAVHLHFSWAERNWSLTSSKPNL